jgi:hypothetical protein
MYLSNCVPGFVHANLYAVVCRLSICYILQATCKLYYAGYLDMSPSRRPSRLEGEDVEGYLRPTFPPPGSPLRHSEALRHAGQPNRAVLLAVLQGDSEDQNANVVANTFPHPLTPLYFNYPA